MQTKDKTGIICDICNTEYNNDFTYFSLDFKNVQNINIPLYHISELPDSKSIDVCTACFDSMSNQIIKINQVPFVVKRCDVSGIKINGNYYYCVVSKIKVIMTGQPYKCLGCKTISQNGKECKCGSTKFIKLAITDVIKRHVEFIISVEKLTELTSVKINNDWGTKS